GHEVIVDVETRRGLGFGFLRKLDVRLRIHAPEGARMRAEAASADLRGRGRFGELHATAASGDLDLDEISGDAQGEAASGDVRLGPTLWVAARAMSGALSSEVALDDVPPGQEDGAPLVELRATSMSGDIDVVRA